jgi:hypothetical protein
VGAIWKTGKVGILVLVRLTWEISSTLAFERSKIGSNILASQNKLQQGPRRNDLIDIQEKQAYRIQ